MKHLLLTALFICALTVYKNEFHRPALHIAAAQHIAMAQQPFAGHLYAGEKTHDRTDFNWAPMWDVVEVSAEAATNDAVYFGGGGV